MQSVEGKRPAIKRKKLFYVTVAVTISILLAPIIFYLIPDDSTVTVYPIFTRTAYMPGGFYDYYNHKCSVQCLTLPLDRKINPAQKLPLYSASTNGRHALFNWGFHNHVNDADITLDPHILDNYDTVIVLHSEYMTQAEYDVIRNHPNVIYLYPNALYANVTYNQKDDTITLVNGHDYGTPKVNPFGFPYENTKEEFDLNCGLDTPFRQIDNGWQYTCYPEVKMAYDPFFIAKIKLDILLEHYGIVI